jgi:hypothetical protein
MFIKKADEYPDYNLYWYVQVGQPTRKKVKSMQGKTHKLE